MIQLQIVYRVSGVQSVVLEEHLLILTTLPFLYLAPEIILKK